MSDYKVAVRIYTYKRTCFTHQKDCAYKYDTHYKIKIKISVLK